MIRGKQEGESYKETFSDATMKSIPTQTSEESQQGSPYKRGDALVFQEIIIG